MNKIEVERAWRRAERRAAVAAVRNRKANWIKGSVVIVAVATAIAAAGALKLGDDSPPPQAQARAAIDSQLTAADAVAKLPLHFEPSHDASSFVSRGRNYLLELDADGATLNLKQGNRHATLDLALVGARAASARGEAPLGGVSNYFVGSDAAEWRTNVPHFARVRYDAVYPGVDLVYYGAGRDLEYDFIVAPGADPAQIQLQYSGAKDVRIDDDGNLRVAIDDGEVVHRKPVVYQTLANGLRESVAGAFRIAKHAVNAAAVISFDLGKYDASRPLVIDPVLTYASYLASTDEDEIVTIAVDATGAVYVAGDTESANFPVTPGAAQTIHGSPAGSDHDVFVAKLNAQGTALEYSTFLGGNDDDRVADIEVDAAGTVYVAGTTISSNFPTVSAADTTFGGGTNSDIFVTHLNAQGTTLLYSTYLGGTRDEGSSNGGSDLGLRVDSSGSAWILSTTDSNDYPVTAGAPQATRSGDPSLFADDWVITKFAANGASLLFSTYFGGAGEEELGHYQHERARTGFYVTDAGIVTIVGTTSNLGIPTTGGVVQPAPGGSEDLAVVRLNTATNTVVFATNLGGTGFERLGGSTIDATGNIYVCGETQGPNFPTTPGAFDTTAAGRDIFVAKLNPTVTSLVYSTLIGGSNADYDPMCRFDAAGNAYIAGSTGSTDFPVTPGAFDTASVFDQGFVAKLNPTGTALAYATYLAESVDAFEINSSGEAYVAFRTPDDTLLVTSGGLAHGDNDDAYFLRLNATGTAGLDATYLGGDGDEIIRAFVLAPSGDVYIAGSTESDNFPTTPGVVQATSGNAGSSTDSDAFIARIAMGDGSSPPPAQPGVVQFSAATYSGNENGGSVTLTLTRTNGADGAISVSVASGGGSAAAGSDYTALTQTVSWPNGDAALKTVSLAVTNDTADEPDETVTVTLSNVSGGASLGSVSNATVTIVDDDPAAVTPPPPPAPTQNGNAQGSYGGGGAMEWFALAALALLVAAARRARLAAVVTLLAVGTSVSQAADLSGWYIGLRGGVAESTQAEADIARALSASGHAVTVDLDDRDASWSFFGGFRAANGFGVELAAVDLGEYELRVSGTTSSPSTLLRDGVHAMADAGEGGSLSLTWALPLGERFEVTPRLGGYYWESRREINSSMGSAREKTSGFNVTGGVSLDWRITASWSFGLAYDIWDAGGHNDVRALSASFAYRLGR